MMRTLHSSVDDSSGLRCLATTLLVSRAYENSALYSSPDDNHRTKRDVMMPPVRQKNHSTNTVPWLGPLQPADSTGQTP
jgi:hypothetical protein